MRLETLSIRLEHISPNIRMLYEQESLVELSRSIRCHGQKEPIAVWWCGETFRILDGEKRWRACKMLGMESIQASIFPPDPIDSRDK